MQAMLVTSNSLKDQQHSRSLRAFDKKPKKEKAPKKVNTNGNVVISPYALDSAPSAGRALEAGNYQPPSVFLKEMEKPDAKKPPTGSSGVLADLWNL
jgi:hypothetical protein